MSVENDTKEDQFDDGKSVELNQNLTYSNEPSTAQNYVPPAKLNWRNLNTFDSLKNGVFRLYFGAMLGQMAAMNMQMMVRSLLIYRLTDSAVHLGYLALAQSLPMLIFSLFGGVLAERAKKKYVLLYGQMASGIFTLGVAFCLTNDWLNTETWWILILAALGQGIIMGLMMPARQAMIADIVRRDQLMNAVALNTLGMNALRLSAPALSGFLIYYFGGDKEGLVGFDAVYYFMTSMYLVAVIFIFIMPHTGVVSLKGKGALADVIDGIRYARYEPIIRVILIITFLTVLLSMPYMFLLPVFTEDVLKVGASGLGVLISISGIGAILGSLILASLPDKHRGAILLFGSLVSGIALTGFAFSTAWIGALIFIFFVGFGQTVRMTLGNALLQFYVQEEYRGRIMSLYMMEFGLTSFGVFAASLIADIIGVQWSIGGMAVALVIATVIVYFVSPRIRQLQ